LDTFNFYSFLTDAQGDNSGGAALTAYVVIALVTVRFTPDTYKDQIDRATQYIADNAATSDDLYTLAIAAYALKLADHPSANIIFDRFDAKAMVKDGFKWWEKPIPSNFGKNQWYYYTNPIDIEITAYGLLTYLAMGKDTEAFPIVRWLIGQRNSLGGFQSTQDTVLSIQGLAKFAEKTSAIAQDIDIAVRWNDGGEYNLKVNTENPLPLSNYELGSETTFVQFDCKGKGLAIGQVSYTYNVLVPEPEPRFNLDINVDETSTKSFLNVTICTSFIPFENTNTSNMVVMEIPFPSGYTLNSERLQLLKNTNNVKV
jgi:CD109 antigen